jgi:hypothetical protein
MYWSNITDKGTLSRALVLVPLVYIWEKPMKIKAQEASEY